MRTRLWEFRSWGRTWDMHRLLPEPHHPEELLRRPGITIADLAELEPALGEEPPAAAAQAEIRVKYAGYLEREDALVRKARAMEEAALPEDTPYLTMEALRVEAREKLNAQKPRSLAAAGRIPGVNPADVAVLMVWLKKRGMETQDTAPETGDQE